MADIPPRPEGALTGKQIAQRFMDILGDTETGTAQELDARRLAAEEFMYQQFAAGNVPAFMRPENFQQVSTETQKGGRTIRVTFRACPDYLAIGSDGDFMRIPVSAPLARRIADDFGFVMPTPRMVDLIDAEAKAGGGLRPFTAAPSIAKRIIDPQSKKGDSVEKKWNYQKYGFYEGRWMLSPQFLTMQNTMIQEAREKMRNAPLRSGHKKEIVYDPIALETAGEGGQPVVIYRKGIQPLSNIHNEKYWDYSHGVHYIDPNVQVTITER